MPKRKLRQRRRAADDPVNGQIHSEGDQTRAYNWNLINIKSKSLV